MSQVEQTSLINELQRAQIGSSDSLTRLRHTRVESTNPYCNQVINHRNTDLTSIAHLKSRSQVYEQAQAARLVATNRAGDPGPNQTEQALVF